MQKKKSAEASYASGLLLLTGIIFIIGSTIYGLLIKCPTQIQCLNVYTLIGVGMACLFFRSAEQSAISYKTSKFSSKIVGCIAVPILLFVINPIDRIKANGCDAPNENSALNNEPTISPDTTLVQRAYEKALQSYLDSCKMNKPVLNSKAPSAENKKAIQPNTVQCNGITKNGTRCKHFTHFANGYCYQHQPH